jgi:hypothetical protein
MATKIDIKRLLLEQYHYYKSAKGIECLVRTPSGERKIIKRHRTTYKFIENDRIEILFIFKIKKGYMVYDGFVQEYMENIFQEFQEDGTFTISFKLSIEETEDNDYE